MPLLAAGLGLPVAGLAAQHFDAGAWSAELPDEPGAPCELVTGGYDRAADALEPLLLVAIDAGEPTGRFQVNVIASTDLTQPELLRARVMLRVAGPAVRTLPLLPTAIVEAERERRVTFRPRFVGDEQAGLRDLVAAMRRAEQVSVEINGLALGPAFSMRGLDALWARAAPPCGLGP